MMNKKEAFAGKGRQAVDTITKAAKNKALLIINTVHTHFFTLAFV